MNIAQVFLVLTMVMPGQQPDPKKTYVMPDLETCEMQIHERLNDPNRARYAAEYGAMGVMAGCLVLNKHEHTTTEGEGKDDNL